MGRAVAPNLYRKGTTPAPGLYAIVYNIKNKDTTPVLARLLFSVESPAILKMNPVAKSRGKQQSNDIKRRYLLPLLSMNQYAMGEKQKLAAPKTNDSHRLSILLNAASLAEFEKKEAARKANILIPLICCAAITTRLATAALRFLLTENN
jgi:hypothetical protein